MSTSISRQISVKAKLELLLLLHDEHTDEWINYTADNSEWKYAARLIPACFEHYGPEPLAGVTNEAVALAVNNADVHAFVEHLFRGDEPLYIPGVRPCAELIPTIVKTFKEKSSAQELRFRPLHLRFINAPLNFRFYELWPDAADRRVRPCPYCSPHVVASMDIDRYHFVDDHHGLRLTVELLYLWLDSYPAGWDGPRQRLRDRVTAVRIFTDRAVQCSRSLPKGLDRELVFLKQAEILEEVFRFAVRDDLDTFQLVCRHFRKFVDGRADALALRAFYEVWLGTEWASGEWFVRISQASRLAQPGGVFEAPSSQTSMETVLSLLRNGCALRFHHTPHSPSVVQPLLDEGVPFAAKMGELRCIDASQEALSESLLRMASVGVRQFHFLMQEVGWMRLLASEALVGAAFVSFRILPGPADQPTLMEVQELADDFLRNSPGKRVSFMMPRFCPVVRADRIIERFLEAEQPGEFTLPLSVQLEFWLDSIPVPARCRYPTLRNVIIPADVLVRHREESARSFDVYHFRNARTKEHLTVCLGKRHDGNVSFIFIQKGRICATVEDIANMEPFPYQLAD